MNSKCCPTRIPLNETPYPEDRTLAETKYKFKHRIKSVHFEMQKKFKNRRNRLIIKLTVLQLNVKNINLHESNNSCIY